MPVRTLSDYVPTENTLELTGSRRLRLLELIRSRLAEGDYRLPFLNNSADSRVFELINSSLDSDELRRLLESFSREEFAVDTLTTLFTAIPRDFLQDFLDLRGNVDVRVFDDFINFLLYCSIGIGDLPSTQAIVNDLLVPILADQRDGDIDTTALTANAEQLRDDVIAENRTRGQQLRETIGRVFSQTDFYTVIRRTAILTGIGTMISVGQPFYGVLFSRLGTTVGTAVMSSVSQTTLTTGATSAAVTSVSSLTSERNHSTSFDAVVSAFSNAFSVLKSFIFDN